MNSHEFIPSLQRSCMHGREKVILKVLPAFAMKKFWFFTLSYHLSSPESLTFRRNSHGCRITVLATKCILGLLETMRVLLFFSGGGFSRTPELEGACRAHSNTCWNKDFCCGRAQWKCVLQWCVGVWYKDGELAAGAKGDTPESQGLSHHNPSKRFRAVGHRWQWSQYHVWWCAYAQYQHPWGRWLFSLCTGPKP